MVAVPSVHPVVDDSRTYSSFGRGEVPEHTHFFSPLEQRYFADRQSLRVGAIRLRQIRAKGKSQITSFLKNGAEQDVGKTYDPYVSPASCADQGAPTEDIEDWVSEKNYTLAWRSPYAG